MKALNIRERTDEELQQLYEDTVKEYRDIKIKKGMGDGSEQPLRVRMVRRDIARIRTVMTERAAAAAAEETATNG